MKVLAFDDASFFVLLFTSVFRFHAAPCVGPDPFLLQDLGGWKIVGPGHRPSVSCE